MNWMITAFILFSISPLQAENQFYVIGGGGEPASVPTTIFDGDLKNLSKFSDKPNYSSSVYFNGGHSVTDGIRDNGFKNAEVKTDFSTSTFDSFLKKLTGDIESGKVKNKEQVLLYISSHGEKANATERAHNIAGKGAISSVADFSGSERIDLAKLQDVITLAENKGIKLAIIDTSCFSGHTLKLKTKNTCIVSSTGKNHYAYSSNPFRDMPNSPLKNFETFGRLMSHGITDKRFKNLEEVFLHARKNSIGADFPEINTPEGLTSQEDLYKSISDYLNIEALNINQLEDLFKKTNTQEAICGFDDSFQSTLSLLTRLERQVASAVNLGPSPFKQLRAYLSEYHQALTNKMSANLALKNNQFPDIKLTVNGNTTTFPMERFLLIKPQKIIEERLKAQTLELEELKKAGIFDEFRKEIESQYADQIALYREIEKEQKRIIQSSPELKQFHDWNNKLDVNATLAFKIGIEARKVAHELYQAKKAGKESPNPCNDFKL